MRRYKPARRRFELSCKENPSFRREDLYGDAAAVRDAAQLRAEVRAPENEDWKKYFRWTILWLDGRAYMYGPIDEDDDVICTFELSHGDAVTRFRDTMHRFIHVGPMAPAAYSAHPDPAAPSGPTEHHKVTFTPAGRALAARAHVTPNSTIDMWIMDTGSGLDIVERAQVESCKKHIRPSTEGIVLQTVNGPTPADSEIRLGSKS
jgi:hypothetical protein